MNRLTPFFTILEECVAFYREMLNFENVKHRAIVYKDTPQLEAIIKVEQAFIMRADLLEKKRLSAQAELGSDGFTLLEMAERLAQEERDRLLAYRKDLLAILQDIKEINKKSMQLLDVRLKDSEKRLESSGYIQDMHTYNSTGVAAPRNAGINKSLLAKSI